MNIMKPNMKPLLPYYGGKSKLVQTLLPFIPDDHVVYAEPFSGGAALFFAKEPSPIEVLNDTNKELINFYRVVQQDFIGLERMIRITLHSRSMHSDASVIYNNPHLFDDIKRAWAVWVLAVQSFSSMLDGSWGYDKKEKATTTKKIINKREAFTEEYAIRLQNVQIECADAVYIIRSRDAKDAFFYCDPPYFNSDCGHYGGYLESDFERLLIQLSNIEGKFILSSYPSDLLERYKRMHNWHQKTIEQYVSVNKGNRGKKKIEVMTANYII
jgi:DNA adenine methylase